MAESEDIEKMLSARRVSRGEMIHFGFKNSVFQLPDGVRPKTVYPLRLSASGVNHLNLLVVSQSECVRLEPQKYAHLMYRAKALNARLAEWCFRQGVAYRIVTGRDETYRDCAAECFRMLDALIENRD